MRDARLIVCAALSVVGHVVFAYAMSRLPRRVEARTKPATVAIRVVAAPPPEPPPEPPEPTPPAPQPVPHERAQPRPTRTPPPTAPPPREAPPPEPTPSAGTSTAPVFGVTMESTSQAGSGPAMPV